jgi:peroxiredoxin Q/BCP
VNLPATADSGLGRFDIALFAASCDSSATNRRFAKTLGLDYPVLSDPDKEVATAYGVVHEGRAYPERWTFIIGVDGKILDVLTKVDTGSHGAEIAARLEELGVDRR